MDNQNNQEYQNIQNNQSYQNNQGFQINPNNIPEEYRPISMWGYFGYELLFSIPCIGLIIIIVFAFGGNQNINVRNFARSQFCILIIAAVIALIVFMIATIMGVGLFSYNSLKRY